MISFNMHQLVLRCVCITLVLHGMALAAAKVLVPTPAQVALFPLSACAAPSTTYAPPPSLPLQPLPWLAPLPRA